MTVIKDCTGSYLRLNGNDYHICNFKIVDTFDNGTKVEGSFNKIDECIDNDEVVCEMYHQNEGWIEVTIINQMRTN